MDPQNDGQPPDPGAWGEFWGKNPMGAAIAILGFLTFFALFVGSMKRTAEPDSPAEAVQGHIDDWPNVDILLAQQAGAHRSLVDLLERLKADGRIKTSVANLDARCDELHTLVLRVRILSPYSESDKRRALIALETERAWACESAAALRRELPNLR